MSGEDFSYEDIFELLRKQTGGVRDTSTEHLVGTVTLNVEEGQSCWHPASTKRSLWGPLTIAYTFHADGGVDATILDA